MREKDLPGKKSEYHALIQEIRLLDHDSFYK